MPRFVNYSRLISITQSISKLPKSSVRTKTLWMDILGGLDIHLDIECRHEDHDGLGVTAVTELE